MNINKEVVRTIVVDWALNTLSGIKDDELFTVDRFYNECEDLADTLIYKCELPRTDGVRRKLITVGSLIACRLVRVKREHRPIRIYDEKKFMKYLSDYI